MPFQYTRWFQIAIIAVLSLVSCTAQSDSKITPQASKVAPTVNMVVENTATSTTVTKTAPTLSNLHCPPEQTAKIVYGESYLGLQFPPEPTWLKFFDSLSIGTYEGRQFGVSHAFDGQNHYFLLSEFLCLDSENHAHHRVVNEIKLPPLNQDDYIFAGACHLNETENHIVAIGQFTDASSEKLIVASRAWQIDFDNASFTELSKEQVEQVECIDDCQSCHSVYK